MSETVSAKMMKVREFHSDVEEKAMGEDRISSHREQQEKLAVDLREAGDMMSVCAKTVKREIKRGRLRGLRVGRVWRVRKAEIKAYLERQERAE